MLHPHRNPYHTHLHHQAEAPSGSMAEDAGVIERMVSQLEAGTRGLAAGYKLTPIQFEKVGPER